jgi:RecG-like helicase
MRFRRRQTASPHKRAEASRAWAAQVPGVTPIRDVEARAVARVAGAVEVLRVRQRDGQPAIEAVVGDGTGTVTAVWLGRRAMPGLTLGSRLVLEGRFAGQQPKLQMLNPHYEFAAV